MITIELPISPTERFAGLALTAGLTVAVALAPVAPPWPWPLGLSVLFLGLFQHQRYLANRPHAATLSASGGLVLHQTAGRMFLISRVRIGYVGAQLVTAQCRNSTGGFVNLVIPSSIVSPEQHRQLRRALLALENVSESVQDRG